MGIFAAAFAGKAVAVVQFTFAEYTDFADDRIFEEFAEKTFLNIGTLCSTAAETACSHACHDHILPSAILFVR